MKRTLILAIGAACLALPAVAATTTLSGDEIKATFGTGKPFSAATLSGKEFSMTFKADGSALMVAKGKKKGEAGKWRVSDKGYCTVWGKSKEHCYTVRKADKLYNVIDGSGRVIAHWSL